MEKTCMKWSVFCGLVFMMGSSTACLEPDGRAPEETGAPATIEEHRPFYVASFDHVPTEEEIQGDLDLFIAEARGGGSRAPVDPIYPVPLPLQAGQKLVRIDATTSDITSAGTADSFEVFFRGTWRRGSVPFTQNFRLSEPHQVNLGRGTTNIYYYVLNMGPNSSDQFVSGLLTNTSTDGWHCHSIKITESNRSGGVRTQSLPFSVWVDTPDYSPTEPVLATSLGILTYP